MEGKERERKFGDEGVAASKFEQQGAPKKKAQEREELGDRFCWTSTTIPIELTQKILSEVTKLHYTPEELAESRLPKPEDAELVIKQEKLSFDERESRAMGVICRNVCSWWRDIVSKPPKPQLPGECFAVVAAKSGNMSLLKWAHENGSDFDELADALYSAASRTGNLESAARGGHIELIKWAINQGLKYHKEGDVHMAILAAEWGHLDLLRYLVNKERKTENENEQESESEKERGKEVRKKESEKEGEGESEIKDEDNINIYMEAAALKGRIDVMEYLLSLFDRNYGEVFLSDQSHLADLAAAGGHLEAVKWLSDRGCVLGPDTFTEAGKSGNIELLRWLKSMKVGWNTDATGNAAAQGHTEALKWLHENGCPWDEMTTNNLANRGEWDLLKWAVSKGCPLYEEAICGFIAAKPGMHGRADKALISQKSNFEELKAMLQWAKDQQHCEWNADTFSAAASWNNFDLLTFLLDRGCPTDENAYTERRRTMEMLNWMLAHGVPYSEATMAQFVEMYDMDVLIWAKENNFPITPNALVVAASIKGDTGFTKLKWLHSNGCPWDVDCCAAAVELGDFERLKWLREQGCPWTNETTDAAIFLKSFDILQWAVENGCLLSPQACTSAVESGSLEILKWLREEQGCPWNEDTCNVAVIKESLPVLMYLKDNGCPWNVLEVLMLAEEASSPIIGGWIRKYLETSGQDVPELPKKDERRGPRIRQTRRF